ncbi:hypothetical protein [Rheinheimera sp.]|uniref:hypothetical protein n=1 Tax=Rheinheimera sp. TaxID=1869214 RepID=UPI003D28A207
MTPTVQLDLDVYLELANRIFDTETYLKLLMEREELQTEAMSMSSFLTGKALETIINARELIDRSVENVGSK